MSVKRLLVSAQCVWREHDQQAHFGLREIKIFAPSRHPAIPPSRPGPGGYQRIIGGDRHSSR